MAGRKKEGFDALKDTTGGKRREDRQIIGKNVFDILTIDTKNVVTVMYLLQSPEDAVKLRAVASLELFGRKDPENLKLLASIGIFEYVLPLVFHEDYIARRFSLKLIGMLSSLEEFREEMLKTENILETFMEILQKDSDAVLQEYSSLSLAQLSKEYFVASDLLQVESCVDVLLQKITSPDPDIEKNCLQSQDTKETEEKGVGAVMRSKGNNIFLLPKTHQGTSPGHPLRYIAECIVHTLLFSEGSKIINHLLNDINGIECFLECPCFDIKSILNLISSSYPEIQSLAIEVLIQLTSWCRDTRILMAFRDAMGIEITLQVMENEEWSDLHVRSLDLLINLTDCPDMCEYLQQSGCLHRFVSLLDSAGDATHVEKILGVLARMTQTKKGREALSSVDVEVRFAGYLDVSHEGIQEASCLGIANLVQNIISLHKLIETKPIKNLLGIITNWEKNLKLRNLAGYALNVFCNADKKGSEALLQEEDYKGLFTILTDSPNLPTELCQNVIQVFVGISHYHELRMSLIGETLLSALISCLPANVCETKDPSLQVDALDCLSEYMVEAEARALFQQLNGIPTLIASLRSKFASVREWAGHLVVIASQDEAFVKDFINQDGLDWMLREKNTMYSMPSWQSAIDTIFANYLPAKFAYTGRLDFQDITQEGFFISINPKVKFVVLDNFAKTMTCPVATIYVANFELPVPPSGENKTPSPISSHVVKTMEPQNLKKFMKGADRNSLEEYTWRGSLNSYASVGYSEQVKKKSICQPITDIPDPYLQENLENLKRRITKEELPFGDMNWSCIHPRLVCNRARIIAEFVAEEMSGPEPAPGCTVYNKEVHENELKCYLGTNIFPLGLIRAGHYLERAMLFKVLADRIGFPCAFVRGSYGRAWIEVSVPVINVEDSGDGSLKEKLPSGTLNSGSERSSEVTVDIYGGHYEKSVSQNSIQTSCPDSLVPEEGFWLPKLYLEAFKGYPSDFLKPNAIVDLVHEPGRLFNIHSLEADEYCGHFIFK